MSVIEETTLVYVAADQNSNKFYRLELHDDGSVRKQWGRVGATGQQQTVAGGAAKYRATISEKERKGYRRVDTTTTAQATPAGTAAAVTPVLAADPTDPDVTNLIGRIARSNRHAIKGLSGGQIRATTEGASTALGPVSASAVAQARNLLRAIEGAFRGGRPYVRLLEDYLSIVPQRVGSRAGWESDFLTHRTSFAAQRSLLDALDSAIIAPTLTSKAAFRYAIRRVQDEHEVRRVRALYEASRNSRHQTRSLQVKAVYAMTDNAQHEATYEATLQRIGGERHLWHGTDASNVLSVLATGLVVSTRAGNGRMFGDGVYFSEQSSKATGYSGTGVWGGRSDDHFVFLADVALGRTCRPRDRAEALREAGGSRYNSISVDGGTCGVRNHEAIVWDTDQIALRYLVELR